ncbi:ABC-type multidrug transport system fused ATPase/permease subunit [Streptomyces sp. HB132]|nr:ABC-type multidrug transport system fused ATPase/permease subunit [Streptomyces sp. HB132]
MAASIILDTVSRGESLVKPLLILVALVVAGAVMSGCQLFILERAGERVVLGLRHRLVARLLDLKVREYDRRQLGDLLSKAGSDTTLLRSVMTANVLDALPGVVTVIGATALMVYLDWVLFLVVLGVLVVVGLGVVPLLARIKSTSRSAQDHVGQLTSALERALSAVRTVKAGNMQAAEADRIGGHAELAYTAGVRTVKLDALAGVGTAMAMQISFLAVLGVGGYRVATGTLPAGDMIAFLLYVMYLASPLMVITAAVTQLQKAFAAAGRIIEVDSMETEDRGTGAVADTSSTVPPRPKQQGRLPAQRRDKPPSVEFEHVGFGYRADEPVLSELSFRVESGTKTAIVGPSGVGKSTVLSLIERFYEPTAGRVLIDGDDINTIPLNELRSWIGYVEQSAPVLAGTLRENLLYGVEREVSDDELDQVVRSVRLDGVVARMPAHLDTSVGERGSQLSGGERQRVAAGRLLLRRPALVLLDEATSQLDSVNERALHDAIDALAHSSTTMVIAHRLSTVISADRIIVLAEGTVKAMGTHAELMERDEFYRQLAKGQLLQQR